MRRHEVGLILRLVGPLIQVASLVLLFGVARPGQTLAGRPVRDWFYGAFGVGLVLVVVGLLLSLGRGTGKPRSRAPGDEL